MLFLGDHRDALGCEDGVYAHHFQEIARALAHYLAQLLHAKEPQNVYLLLHLAQVLPEVLRSKEFEEHAHVDVLSSPLSVDKANHRIED